MEFSINGIQTVEVLLVKKQRCKCNAKLQAQSSCGLFSFRSRPFEIQRFLNRKHKNVEVGDLSLQIFQINEFTSEIKFAEVKCQLSTTAN